jgi:chemotaxis protein CheX
MDTQLINPIVESTYHVLNTIADTDVRAGEPYQKEDHIARGDVTGVIGLTGEASGTISVSFTEKCILTVVSRMFGEEVSSLNREIQDAVGEIANMISGHSRQRLESMGKSLRAAIPTVIMGKDHSISHITTFPVMAIPFSTDYGDFTVEICIEDNQLKGA